MKIVTLTVILGLPLMALGQTEQQQTQGQARENETTAPAKGKKMRSAQESSQAQTKSGTSKDMRGGTKERAQHADRTQSDARSSTGQTSTRQTSTGQTSVNQSNTTVNVQEFKSRHSEVFSLGRHPKDFFVQRFGTNHVRLIGNSYFAFVDGCWVAVDVDGFTYTDRMICRGDPEFIAVD